MGESFLGGLWPPSGQGLHHLSLHQLCSEMDPEQVLGLWMSICGVNELGIFKTAQTAQVGHALLRAP